MWKEERQNPSDAGSVPSVPASPYPPLGERCISMESRNRSFCLVKTRFFSILGFCWREMWSEILPVARGLN